MYIGVAIEGGMKYSHYVDSFGNSDMWSFGLEVAVMQEVVMHKDVKGDSNDAGSSCA